MTWLVKIMILRSELGKRTVKSSLPFVQDHQNLLQFFHSKRKLSGSGGSLTDHVPESWHCVLHLFYYCGSKVVMNRHKTQGQLSCCIERNASCLKSFLRAVACSESRSLLDNSVIYPKIKQYVTWTPHPTHFGNACPSLTIRQQSQPSHGSANFEQRVAIVSGFPAMIYGFPLFLW